MATIQDIVTGALRNLGVIAATEDPEAAVAAKALTALNEMMLALPARGVHAGWSTLALTATFPLEDRHIRGVKWMLAGEICENHGIVLTTKQKGYVQEGLDLLAADYKISDDMRVDDGLRCMPSQRLWWG